MNRLAIIIPYFKISFFEETLISLKNQTDQRFNVYIGDDASPNNPENLIDNYSRYFSCKYHLFNKNIGSISLTKQWDRAIGLSKNEDWLMVLGDDDMLSYNVVSEFYRCLEFAESKVNVIRFATSIIKGTQSSDIIFENPQFENSQNSFFRRLFLGGRSTLSEYIFKRESYDKYGFKNYPLAWHSDDKAWLDFSESLPIYSINSSVVYIRKSKESVTGKSDNLKSKIEASVLFYNDLLKSNLYDFSREQKIKIITKFLKITINESQLNFDHIFTALIKSKFNLKIVKMILKNYLKLFY